MTSPILELFAPDHPVKSVTVYKSSKAKVVRAFEVEIKAGKTKINVSKLPSSLRLDTNHVRFSTSSDDVQVLGVVSGVSTVKPEHNDSIRELKLRKSGLESEKNMREYEADLLVTYAKTLNGEHIQPEQVSTFLDGFVERGKKNLGAVMMLTEEILAIERSIQEETRKSLITKDGARAHVSVVLACTEPQTVVLNMTYIVSDVHWRPHYELHLTTPKSSSPTNPPKLPSATLYYYATISQRTGEDWSNASLTLSTSSPFSTSSLSVPSQPQWRGQVGVPRLTPVKLSSPPAPAPGKVTFGQPSIPQNLSGSNGPTGSTSAFGTSNTGSAFGSQPTFGSAQPAQKTSATFGYSASHTTQSQPQPQPPPLFGASSSSHLPQNSGMGPSFGQPTSNSAIAPGFGAFGQQPSSLGGGVFGGLAPQQAQGMFGQSPNVAASSQPASSGFGAFGLPQQTQGTLGQSAASTQPASSGFGAQPNPGSSSNTFGQHARPSSTTGFSAFTQCQPSQFGRGVSGSSASHQQAQAQGTFGQSTNAKASSQPTSSGTGSFGGSTAGGLFGSSASQQRAQTQEKIDVQHIGDISSDGADHQVIVAVTPLEVGRLDRVCVPRLGGQVWLQCQVKNTSGLKLLAGPMTVIADDTHVAGISVDDISQADTFTCLLGDDPDVHLSYTLVSQLVSPSNAPQSQFADAPLSKTTFTSKVVLWNNHPWAIRDVVVKDVVPVYCKRNQPSLFGSYVSNQKVVLRKPEGLADVLEGTEVGVWAEVFNTQEMDPKVKIEESERDYVEVDERDKEPEEKGKGKGKESETEKPQRVKRVKAMWEKSANGMGGEQEGRFEWKCGEVGAGEKVVLEAQWETAGTPYMRWIEVAT